MGSVPGMKATQVLDYRHVGSRHTRSSSSSRRKVTLTHLTRTTALSAFHGELSNQRSKLLRLRLRRTKTSSKTSADTACSISMAVNFSSTKLVAVAAQNANSTQSSNLQRTAEEPSRKRRTGETNITQYSRQFKFPGR